MARVTHCSLPSILLCCFSHVLRRACSSLADTHRQRSDWGHASCLLLATTPPRRATRAEDTHATRAHNHPRRRSDHRARSSRLRPRRIMSRSPAASPAGRASPDRRLSDADSTPHASPQRLRKRNQAGEEVGSGKGTYGAVEVVACAGGHCERARRSIRIRQIFS